MTKPPDVMLNGVKYLVELMPRLFPNARFFDRDVKMTWFS